MRVSKAQMRTGGAARASRYGGGALGVVALLGVMTMRLDAQAPVATPQFDVASVKPNISGDGRVRIGLQPGGHFSVINMPLRMLVKSAYGLQDSQLIGGPSWMATDCFDILATAAGNPTQERLALMMRALLAERFGFAAHHEVRDLPIYALVSARPDGKPGPQLRQTTSECEKGVRSTSPRLPGAPPACGMRMGVGTLIAGGMPLSQLATMLGHEVDRVVQDQTGLTGKFDFDLSWTPEGNAVAPTAPPADAKPPSLFVALQEQLGLKLDAQRASVDVIVVDKIGRPTPD
jgi:uncharacterized protein (TIGR03435 family)